MKLTLSAKPGSSRSADRWENEGGPIRLPGSTAQDDLGAELKRLGITPVQMTVFDWSGYRYSNARDAIAAAVRGIEQPHASAAITPTGVDVAGGHG